MPSNYTGDPTATQAPATAPGFDAGVVSQLPVDADAANAASWYQPVKALSDFVAWLFKPRSADADADDAKWAEPIVAFRSAELHKRACIDHHGYPAGKYYGADEDWAYLTNGTGIGTGIFSENHEQYMNGANALIQTSFGTGTYGAPELKLQPGGTSGDVCKIRRNGGVYAQSPSTISFEFDLLPLATGSSAVMQVFAGLSASTISGDPLGAVGAGFIRRVGDTNWFAYLKKSGGTNQLVDTGVAAEAAVAARRFRIDLMGATAGDGAAARAVFIVDGAKVAVITTDAADLCSGTQLQLTWEGRVGTTGIGSTVTVGPYRYRANHWNDVAI